MPKTGWCPESPERGILGGGDHSCSLASGAGFEVAPEETESRAAVSQAPLKTSAWEELLRVDAGRVPRLMRVRARLLSALFDVPLLLPRVKRQDSGAVAVAAVQPRTSVLWGLL